MCCDRARCCPVAAEWRPVAVEPGHGGRAEPGDDHQVRPADAGDHLAVAAADAAVGAGVGRRLPGQPPAELRRRRRPGDVRQHRRRGAGDPGGAGRAAAAARLRGRGGAERAGRPVRPAATSSAGEVLAEAGSPADEIVPASPTARSHKVGTGPVRRRADRLGRAGRRRPLRRPGAARARTPTWDFTAKAVTAGTAADPAPAGASTALVARSEALRAHLAGTRSERSSSRRTSTARPRSSSPPGHAGEPDLPGHLRRLRAHARASTS